MFQSYGICHHFQPPLPRTVGIIKSENDDNCGLLINYIIEYSINKAFSELQFSFSFEGVNGKTNIFKTGAGYSCLTKLTS